MFHRHEWVVVAQTFNPPALVKDTKFTGDMNTMQIMFYGITNITQQCKDCGRQTYETVIGRVS